MTDGLPDRPPAVRRVRDLPADRQADLRRLHALNPWWNLKILVFALIWIVAAAVALRVSALPVRLACYFIIGATIQGLVILMHEAVHGIMFRDRGLNRWVGFLCGLPAFLSVSAYRMGHLPHHRYERSARDPVVVSNPFVAFFMCNLNYHIEHHLFPAVPWYRLRRLHALLGDELRRSGAQVYLSYTRFLWDLSRFVVLAYAPGGERLPLRLPVAARRRLDEGLTGPAQT